MRQIYSEDSDGIWRWKTVDRKRPPRLGPQVMTDEMPLTWAPFNGQHYDSKGRMRRAAKEAGLVEVGNDYRGPRREYDSGTLDAEIRYAVNK